MEHLTSFKTISFDQLIQFRSDQNFLQLMRELSTVAIESEDSDSQIRMIIDLRRMRKFHSDLFVVTFNNIVSSFIDNMIYNNDSNVIFQALVLITEIFSQYGQEEVGEWVRDLLQAVLQQSSGSNEEIRKQCSLALYNASYNMYFEDTLTTFVKSLGEQDEIISENALEGLKALIYFCDPIALAHQFFWDESFCFILESLKGDDIRVVNKIRNVIISLEDKLKDLFDPFLSEKLNEEQKKIICIFLQSNQ